MLYITILSLLAPLASAGVKGFGIIFSVLGPREGRGLVCSMANSIGIYKLYNSYSNIEILIVYIYIYIYTYIYIYNIHILKVV